MKLNQIIALVSGKKTKIQQMMTSVHHGWKKDRISGIIRTYTPLEENGEMCPSESRIVQVKVDKALGDVKSQLVDFMNIIATQEYANTSAKSDVIVDDETILVGVPVSALLFLDKQLIDLHTLAVNLPTLSTDKVWTKDEAKNCWVTEPEQTSKTSKKIEPIVKYEATEHHPAQTELISLDRTVGHWTSIHLSGALPENERDDIIGRIDKLRDAVKVARENANNADVTINGSFGNSVIGYIFTSK